MDFLRHAVLAAVGSGLTVPDKILVNPVIVPSILTRFGLDSSLSGAIAHDESQSLLAVGLSNGSWLVLGNHLEFRLAMDNFGRDSVRKLHSLQHQPTNRSTHSLHADSTYQKPSVPFHRASQSSTQFHSLNSSVVQTSRKIPGLAFKLGDCYLVATTPLAPTQIVVWNIQLKTLHLQIQLSDPVTAFQICPDSSWVAVGLSSGLVSMVDMVSGQISPYSFHQPTFSSKEDYNDATAAISSVTATASSISLQNTSVRQLLFSPTNPNHLLVVCETGPIFLWNVSQKQCLKWFVYTTNADSKSTDPLPCLSACWRPDGEQIVATYTDNQLVFWNMKEDWVSLITSGDIHKRISKKPALVRHVLASASMTPKEKLNQPEVWPIKQLHWILLGPDHGSILFVSGGMFKNASNGIACLFFTAKYDMRSNHIVETVVPIVGTVATFVVIPQTKSRQQNNSAHSSDSRPNVEVVAVTEGGLCVAFNLQDKNITPLSLPGRLQCQTSVQDNNLQTNTTLVSSANVHTLTHMECSLKLYRDIESYSHSFLPPALELAGGQARKLNIVRINDIISIVRPDKQIEFWSGMASGGSPMWLFTTPFGEWLPNSDIDHIWHCLDRKLLCIQMGPCVVYHIFTMPAKEVENQSDDGPDHDIEDIDAMMAKLDETIGQVLEDSAAITSLALHNIDQTKPEHENEFYDESQTHPSTTDQLESTKKNDHLVSHADVDSQEGNKNVWVTSLEEKHFQSAQCWKPLFQVIHTSEVLLSEYADWMNILATATSEFVHFTDTISGREIFTDKLSDTVYPLHPNERFSSSQQYCFATFMCFAPLLTGDDPTPQLSLVVATSNGTILAYTIVFDFVSHKVNPQRHNLYTPDSTSMHRAVNSTTESSFHLSEDASPIHLTVLDDQGRVLRSDYRYRPSNDIEQHIVVVSRRSVKILVLKTDRNPFVEAQQSFSETQHIVCGRVVYILNDAPHVVAVTNLGRLIVFVLPSLEMIAQVPLPSGIDSRNLAKTTITLDGRLGCWMADGHWEMFGIISNPTQYPQIDIRLYDLYRQSQWYNAKGIQQSSTHRNAQHDLLFGSTYSQRDELGLDKTNKPRGNDAMSAMTNKLDERGERLAQMETKTSELADASKQFVSRIKEYNEQQAKKSWWQF
ncbi:hypothetical protein O5D80_000637 [Batrachochytrium dendrobatidis]|nr:hypothetical protein O5D80_000637 [Batrachochytrium dendrobatidis]